MVAIFDSLEDKTMRLWINELPDVGMNKFQVIEKSVAVCLPSRPLLRKQMALEIYLPRRNSFYGMLGIDFWPDQSVDELYIRTFYCNGVGVSKFIPIAANKSTVLGGLREEYADTVTSTMCAAISERKQFPAGFLEIKAAACCEIGSSRHIFSVIAKVLLKLFVDERMEWSSDELFVLFDEIEAEQRQI